MSDRVILDVMVYGLPQAQGRPRAFKDKGGNVRVYDPATSKAWKKAIKEQILMNHAPDDGLYEGPVHMSCTFALLRPKSLPKKVTEPAKRPDLDNYVKALTDSLTGIVIRDDSQIVEMFARKMYGDPPGVRVKLERL